MSTVCMINAPPNEKRPAAQAGNGVNPIQGSRLIFLLVAREEAAAFASAKKPLSGKESEIFNMYSEPYRD